MKLQLFTLLRHCLKALSCVFVLFMLANLASCSSESKPGGGPGTYAPDSIKVFAAFEVSFVPNTSDSIKQLASNCIQKSLLDTLNAMRITSVCKIMPNMIQSTDLKFPDQMIIAVLNKDTSAAVCPPCTCANLCKMCIDIRNLNCAGIPNPVQSVTDLSAADLLGKILK